MKKRFVGWFLIINIGFLGGLYVKYKREINKIFKPITTLITEEVEMVEINQITPTSTLKSKILNPTLKPTIKPRVIVVPTIKKVYKPTPTSDNEPWGVAKQIDEVTWTMKIGQDSIMATAKEIWEALNEYRKNHGSQVLNWDNKLADYAQSRAKYLNSIRSVDKHAGFTNFIENEDGFNKLGFSALGENISFGYKLNGVHIIEWMYAADEPHNKNQLDNRWNYVGIGVDGLATCLIFGTGKF